MKKCEVCQEYLLNVDGKIYLHPLDSQCQNKDGWEIRILSKFLTDKFAEKYGKPEYKVEEFYSSKLFKLWLYLRKKNVQVKKV